VRQFVRSHTPVLVSVGLLLAVWGCGKKRLIGEEKPTLVQPGIYEILWVEPQIILADSLVTLIRSDRIDSAIVKPPERGIADPSAVELRILQATCNVSVDLLDSNLRLIRPLLLRDLPIGFYRLTLNADRFREPSLPSGRYFLRAQYCGRSEMKMFIRP
jgi:hypothetical protein